MRVKPRLGNDITRVLDPDTQEVVCYIADGGLMAIPPDSRNRHYQEIQEKVRRGVANISDRQDSRPS